MGPPVGQIPDPPTMWRKGSRPKAAHHRGRMNQRMEEGGALEGRLARRPSEDRPTEKGREVHGSTTERPVQRLVSEEESCASQELKRMSGSEGRLRKAGTWERGAFTTLMLYRASSDH